MSRITKSQIQNLVGLIGKETGFALSRSQATAENKGSFLWVDYAPIYGGYRLVMVNVSNGGHWGAFQGNGCERRMKAQEFYSYLSGIYVGLKGKS